MNDETINQYYIFPHTTRSHRCKQLHCTGAVYTPHMMVHYTLPGAPQLRGVAHNQKSNPSPTLARARRSGDTMIRFTPYTLTVG